jgi:hypothetical protein
MHIIKNNIFLEYNKKGEIFEKNSQYWQPRFLTKQPTYTPPIFDPTVQNEE